jgi:hypothetical protein
MKYCPECETDFPDSDRFCDFDGTLLEFLDPVSELNPDPDAGLKPETNLKMIAIAVSGVVIGVILFLIYATMTREPAQQSPNTSSSNASVVMQQQVPLLPSAPSPVASATPSVEPSPTPSAMPSPSPQTERRLELSSSAISTDVNQKTKSGPLIIRLKDGARIESDEAWQTGEGIWCRSGSVIALLDPKQVKAIEKLKPATPPSATPAPSPSATPVSAASQSSPRILTPTRRQR